MFSTRNLLLAGALLAAAPAPALLAQQGMGAHTEGAGHAHEGPNAMHSPVQVLIDHRADLGLSDDQVTRLQQIDQDLHRRMEPFHQQMMQMHAGMHQPGQGQPSEADRAAMHQRMEQARPMMEQVHKIHQEAMQQAGAVLTAEQREKAHQYMPRHGEHDGHGEHGEHGGHEGHEGHEGQGGGSR